MKTAETQPDSRPVSTLYALVQCRNSLEICTLYPPTVIGPHRTESWIRATGDSFQSLEKSR
ncbi:DUF7511 domain-containing protein [Natronosalvus amylolyticus]|uniref:DUF7511 domain-containing protein n=1 Tax=Natronosalvus amylolyticus TaxID=2961994 RepID=UPI003CCD951D